MLQPHPRELAESSMAASSIAEVNMNSGSSRDVINRYGTIRMFDSIITSFSHRDT